MTLSFGPSKSILDQEVPYGRFGGCKWEDLIPNYPDYILWAMDHWDFLTQPQKDELHDAIVEYHGDPDDWGPGSSPWSEINELM